jgi:cobalt-zinc-cadmium efflux system outer membrane protein
VERLNRRPLSILFLGFCAHCVYAQQPYTWNEVRERFRQNNPNLLAGQLTIEENRANEITANLRPNPEFGFTADQFRVFKPNPLQPFQNAQLSPTLSQLFERRNKRQLRLASAELVTKASATDQLDLERNLTFNLRDSFNRVLLAKALLQLAKENLAYYDRVVQVNQERLKAGDISRVDFVRVDLQHVQFESDLVNAQVNLRTAKIQLLAFLNDRRPVDNFDVAGPFDFSERLLVLEELRRQALDTRPDLRSAVTLVERARADHRLAIANGSTDPIIGLEIQRTQADNTAGIFFQLPLRIFDRNQGEKARTSIVIQQNERNRQGIEAGVLRDVESGLATLDSVVSLLKPYRDRYIPESVEIRDKINFAFTNGGASLLDFLDAQRSFRDTQVAYLNLVGNYYMSANQLNLAVGQEVIQ